MDDRVEPAQVVGTELAHVDAPLLDGRIGRVEVAPVVEPRVDTDDVVAGRRAGRGR